MARQPPSCFFCHFLVTFYEKFLTRVKKYHYMLVQARLSLSRGGDAHRNSRQIDVLEL